MAIELQDPHLYLPSAGVAGLHSQTQLLKWVLGVQTQILMFVQGALSVLSFPPDPAAVASSTCPYSIFLLLYVFLDPLL